MTGGALLTRATSGESAPIAPTPPPRGAAPALVRGLSLLSVIALVTGNMLGTSIYTLPASLAAATGPLGIVAWILTGGGYFFVALVYARLGSRYPRSGGPYVYAREAFGDFAGFQTMWAYWTSAVIGNAAVATSIVGYATGISPTLAASVPAQFVVAQGIIWTLCWINVRGVRESARLQVTIMFVTVIPLVAISALSLRAFDAANFHPFAPHGAASLSAGMAMVVWAYSGVESATVTAEEITAPEHVIRRGTMLSYWIGTGVFLLCALAATGAVPNALLATSPRPLALVAERVVGGWAAAAMSFAAIVGGIGTLNGWTLMAGRIPLAAAQDDLFFRTLARIHPRHGTPYVAIIAGSCVASVMCLMYFSRTLLGVFEFLILLAVLTTLLPHLYAAAADLMLTRRSAVLNPPSRRRRQELVALVAFAFVLFTIYGTGAEVALWGFLVVLAGTPLYVWLRTRGPQ